MDKKQNPLINPPDTVLKAALVLDTNVSFNVIRKWIDSCLSHTLKRMPYGKEDVELRWTQGQVQAISLIIVALFNPRQELAEREKAAAENALSRNL